MKTKNPKENALCKIDGCKHFDTCNKIQVKGNEVKCIKYESKYNF